MPRRLLVAIALATAAAPAQQQDGNAWHLRRRPLTTLGSYTQPLADTLAAMGKDVDHVPRKLRHHVSASWLALAFSGQGSGMRSGRHKAHIKRMITSLTPKLAEWKDHPTKRPKREEILLVTLAMTRIQSQSDYTLLVRFVGWSLDLWLPDAVAAENPAWSKDERILLVVLAESLRHTRFRAQQKRVLELATEAVARIPAGKDRLNDGLRHYLELVQGKKHPPELTVAKCWPGDELKDPMHTWFGAFALRDLPPSIRASQRDRTRQLIALRGKDHMFPASGGYTRTITTAMMTSAIGMTAIHDSPATEADRLVRPKNNDWDAPIK